MLLISQSARVLANHRAREPCNGLFVPELRLLIRNKLLSILVVWIASRTGIVPNRLVEAGAENT
jgi:hypothetical protein